MDHCRHQYIGRTSVQCYELDAPHLFAEFGTATGAVRSF